MEQIQPRRGKSSQRRIWSAELHQHFVVAYNFLLANGEHASPTKIIRVMSQLGAPGMEGLTNRQVQSHHQKYQLKLNSLNTKMAAFSTLQVNSFGGCNMEGFVPPVSFPQQRHAQPLLIPNTNVSESSSDPSTGPHLFGAQSTDSGSTVPGVLAAPQRENEFLESKQPRRPKGTHKNAPRRMWSAELHYYFVVAYNFLVAIGQHAAPTKIIRVMQQMGAPGMEGLTNRQVQSHYQKYQLKLNNLNVKTGGCNFQPLLLNCFPQPPAGRFDSGLFDSAPPSPPCSSDTECGSAFTLPLDVSGLDQLPMLSTSWSTDDSDSDSTGSDLPDMAATALPAAAAWEEQLPGSAVEPYPLFFSIDLPPFPGNTAP